MNKGFSIAIDGPVASGKGTVAGALANLLDGIFINTGGMYRCVALLCIQNNLNINSENEVIKILPKVNVEFNNGQVYLNGENVSERLKEADVAHGSSVVAVYEKVRKDLVNKQQEIAKGLISKQKVVILEGRDTGTKVMPNADIKIFLTASVDVRAKRSLNRDKKRGDIKKYEDVLRETKIRDERDTQREIDPLPSNPENLGYFVLDNSNQTEDESVNVIFEKLKKRKLINDTY